MKYIGWIVSVFLLVLLIFVNYQNVKLKNFVSRHDFGSGFAYSLKFESVDTFKIFTTADGVVHLIKNKVNDHIQVIGFYPNGVVQVKGKVGSNGGWSGQVYYFYKNGNLEGIFNYVDGIKSGSAVTFHDSTDRFKEIMLYNDLGELYYRKTFDITGNLIKTEGSK